MYDQVDWRVYLASVVSLSCSSGFVALNTFGKFSGFESRVGSIGVIVFLLLAILLLLILRIKNKEFFKYVMTRKARNTGKEEFGTLPKWPERLLWVCVVVALVAFIISAII
ncbi:hypothetical protein [Pygmaiobacter massiliensis]|uniref:hypothetical protein n=1 Tax=Pygmaiobacter massiliensis TaxID=1917873 RepID=UPI000C7A2D1F|nr:hypothetical protein [Pygmaiobacter massiliensis]